MAKILKITSRILGGIVEWVLILVIFLAFAVRFPVFQTFLARVATNFLSKELDAELRIGRVDIYFFDRIALDDVFVRDQKGDTLASLGSLRVNLSLLHLNPDAPVINSVALENGRVGIDRDSITGKYNYQFIADYFDSKPKRNRPKKKTNVTVDEIKLTNIHLTYDDNRKSINEFGVDYDHMNFRHLSLLMKDLHLLGKNISFDLQQLSGLERSGLDVKRIAAKAKIGEGGILLDDVKINTFHSRIFASKFNLRMKDLEALQNFEDSVTFDAKIDSSRVSLYDVSLFAPALKGMTQRVQLTASLSQKIPNLKISGIDLRTGSKTVVRGSLILPDFKDPKKSYLQETIDYAYIDLKDVQTLRLPDSAKEHFIRLSKQIDRVGYAELQRTTITGYWSQFVFASRQVRTDIGTVHLDNGLMFTELKEGGYAFERSANSEYDILIDSLNLGKFLGNQTFGKVKGSVFASGVVGQKDNIRITELSGNFDRLDLKGYSYTNIAVTDGSFVNNVFDANIAINDPNLELTFDGYLDLNRQQEFRFVVDIPKANLANLNLLKGDSVSVVTTLSADIRGTGISDYSGRIQLDRFRMVKDSNTIDIPGLTAQLERGGDQDVLRVESAIANIDASGKIDFATIGPSVNNALVPFVPFLLSPKPLPKRRVSNDHFDLTLTVLDPKEVLAIFAPGLGISSGSRVTMHYDARTQDLSTDLSAATVTFNKMVIRDLRAVQTASNGVAKASVNASSFRLNDSLAVYKVDIDIDGTNGRYNTIAKWNDSLPNPGMFDFTTTITGAPGSLNPTLTGMAVATSSPVVNVELRPSFFTIKGNRWDVMNTAGIVYGNNRVEISHLVFEHEAQFIALNGAVSAREEDLLTADINDLRLEEFSAILDPSLDIQGMVNGKVSVGTAFTTPRIDGDLHVKDLFVSKSPIGDVDFSGVWDGANERVAVKGDLRYLQNETFDFSGYYYPYKEEALDFDLKFSGMDLGFTNAFMDPKVVSNIGGTIAGNLKVNGKAKAPRIDGKLNLSEGRVKVGILGTTFRMNGPIEFVGKDNALEIERMPILDEEGNRATLEGYIYHTEFRNWNCNLGFYIDENKTSKFLVLNTPYKEGQIYYGRAYVTGTANIFVTEQLTEILVDVRTEDGTRIDIPMYGNAELSENDVVIFEENGIPVIADSLAAALDLSNVELDLNFDVTDDAQVKLIFNEKTGDEITVRGNGDIRIRINALGDVVMDGTYTISEGLYNFVLGPVNQKFNIEEGGTISWTGDPTDATLQIRTYNKVNANFADVGISSLDSRTNTTQEIYCILELSGKLSEPVIILDIQAPKATEEERAILNSIKSNKDELQKQFFSLLLLKKFVPLNGAVSGAGSGVADVLTGQINSLLKDFGGDTKLQVGYQQSDAQQNKELSLSAQRNLGRNFVLRTSLGVSNSTNSAAGSQSQLIGDMSLEYLINEDGTFRVNLFNESNENTVLQDNSQGLFTQGVGLHYQEDFNSVRDFKLLQFVLDIFRKDKHIKRTKRRQLTSVNEEIPLRNKSKEQIIEPGGGGNLPTPPGPSGGSPAPSSGSNSNIQDAVLPSTEED
jgi:hypothetical protein